MAQRIQRQRTKDWRMPDAVHAATPTHNGPVVIGSHDTCLRCKMPIILTATAWVHA